LSRPIFDLLDDCAERAHPDRLLLEGAMGQAAPVADYARALGLHAVAHRDLAGIDRVVDVRWQFD
jgi:hypothetical protein